MNIISIVRVIANLMVLVLLLGCFKERDEAVVPKSLSNGTVAIVKSGRNWPERQYKSEVSATINHRYPREQGFSLKVSKRELYSAGFYIDRELLHFALLPINTGKVFFLAPDQIRQNIYKGIYLPFAAFDIVHEDEPHGYYELDPSHDNWIDLVLIDEATETVKARFEVKFKFRGTEAEWKKALQEFDDVKEKTFVVYGEVEVKGFEHFK